MDFALGFRSTSQSLCAERGGEQYDGPLGLYYLRARYYNPATGRFLTMDSAPGSHRRSCYDLQRPWWIQPRFQAR
jgi:uncharacterized protein RhaS with RHS repeats